MIDKELTFSAISYDSVVLPSGVTSESEGFLVTAQSEADITRWLFSERNVRALALRELALPGNAGAWFGIGEPLARPSQKPGDIDVLVCDREAPENATAIEVKCIKVRSETDDEDSVNRFEKLRRAVQQANGLLTLGFHRVYLGVVLLVDARAHSQAHLPFREVGNRTLLRLIHFLEECRLGNDAGVLLVEVAQPSTKGFLRAANINVCGYRPAAKRQQPSDLSQRIAAYIELN